MELIRDLFDEPREAYTVNKLPNNKLLIFGGIKKRVVGIVDYEPVDTFAMLYDPLEKKFEKIIVGDEIKCRAFHYATSRADGNVIIFGGCSYDKKCKENIDNFGLIYDWRMNKFNITASTDIVHIYSILQLDNGKILLIGLDEAAKKIYDDYLESADGDITQPYLFSSVIYDPEQNIYYESNIPPLSLSNLECNQMVSLADDDILFIELEHNRLERYDIINGKSIKSINLKYDDYQFSCLHKIDDENFIVLGGNYSSFDPLNVERVNITSSEIKLHDNVEINNDYDFIIEDGIIQYVDYTTGKLSYYDIKQNMVNITEIVKGLPCKHGPLTQLEIAELDKEIAKQGIPF